jgi:hypothetical protein
MRIIINEHQHAPGVFAFHVVHTERAAWNQIPDPRNALVKMDVIDFLALLQSTPALVAGTGWDQITTLLTYPGKTLLQVLQSEVVRLNDAAARAILGV